jgi:hypothetical protein
MNPYLSASRIELYANEFSNSCCPDMVKTSSEESYSAIMRELNKNYDKDDVREFQEEFKKNFDRALLNGIEEPEKISLEKAIKVLPERFEDKIEKAAAAVDLGQPELAGRYLADLIRFLLKRISPERRSKAIDSMKRKIYYLNEFSIASKRTPPSSSMGQTLTLLKTILLEHNPSYIRQVLNNIVRNM